MDFLARLANAARSPSETCVSNASHQRSDPFGVQEPVDSARHVQSQIFFQHAAAHCAGVLTAVAGIKNNYYKWLGSRRALDRSGFRFSGGSLRVTELHPDKGCDH